MSVGVMKDYKLKQTNLRASHTLVGLGTGKVIFNFGGQAYIRGGVNRILQQMLSFSFARRIGKGPRSSASI
jgi:hypothetical protein